MSGLKESQHLKIPLKKIELATNNFETCIGKGGYGQVYKGELSISGKPTTVAVKRLNEQFGQGLKEFLTEVHLLTGQKHPNLITLIGYCDDGKEKILVYEYADHGSLDQYLRSSNTACSLTWLKRLRICLGAARGLDHLHNHVGKHQTIIHRDIKSANILIDENWVAKISDLGLSKLGFADLNRSIIISAACGTRGYCEPEYFASGILKKESDIYSFGMVLFEVLCGRLCLVVGHDGLLLSGPLVKDYYKKKKLHEIVDPSLKEQLSSESINKFSALAYGCMHDERGQRPTIDLVVKELDESLQFHLLSIDDDGKKHESISQNPISKYWESGSEFRFEKIRRIFQHFDCNKDGGLNREEMTALVVGVNPRVKFTDEQIKAILEEVFTTYGDFVDSEKGLTFDGLLCTYADGAGDVDRDFGVLELDLRPDDHNEAASSLA